MGAGTETAPRGRSLYEINEELDTILAAMDGEEYDEESIQSAVDAWLDANRDEVEKKLDDYCAVIQSRTSMAKARKDEATRLRDMAASDERVATLLKDRAIAFFERAKITKLETLRFKPHVQANGGKPLLDLSEEAVLNPETLPEEFRLYSLLPHVEAIRKALDEGRELPFAHYEPRGVHFRIR